MYVEFFGIPRERTGLAELELPASTLGEALAALADRFPHFGELVSNGRLHPSLAASLNANEFVSDPHTPLAAHDRLLLLSADAGG
jgi:molybdopterin converting factor small subunit